MPKFRKKPVEIEAMLFNEETKQAVYNWVRDQQMNITPSFDEDTLPILIIPTLEGDMICSVGDYLIKEPFPTDWRKFYPCKPSIFEKTYDAVLPTDKENNASHWAINALVEVKTLVERYNKEAPSQICGCSNHVYNEVQSALIKNQG